MPQVDTHCPYCALQCGMSLDGARVTPRDFPVNAGGLCQKGWTAGALLTSPRRLTTPMIRVDGALEPVSWDFALDFVARKLREVQETHGPDGVAVFGGGGLTNEKAYLLGKFARVALGTSQIDYNGRFCMSSAAAAGTKAFGADRGMPFPVTDLKNADVVLLAGANPAETMPPFTQHLRGADLIVVDPRRTPTAELASLHLAPSPGTDLALALGILHAVVADGHLDQSYVDERTSGFAEMWRIAASWWPERAERVCGVSAADMRLAAAKLAAARNAYILTARGTEQHATGTATVGAWINLALSLGLPGRKGSGYGCLTGQGNGQGGREHGQKADQLPGYRKLDDPAAREYVAGVWGVEPDSLPGPGRSASELLEALGQDGGPKALMVFGSNVVVSAPRSQRVQDRLSSLDFLVVADFVLSETAAMADVVLPVTQWAEEDGTLTNLEGRVLLRRKALDPPVGCPVRPGRPQRARRAARSARRDGSRPTPRRRSRSCGSRPRAGSPTTPASATTGCAPARPCTGRCRRTTTPAPRGCSSTPSPTRTAARGSCRSSTPARPSCRTRSSRCRPPPAACCSTTSRARRRG